MLRTKRFQWEALYIGKFVKTLPKAVNELSLGALVTDLSVLRDSTFGCNVIRPRTGYKFDVWVTWVAIRSQNRRSGSQGWRFYFTKHSFSPPTLACQGPSSNVLDPIAYHIYICIYVCIIEM